jgi:hypothetical protein
MSASFKVYIMCKACWDVQGAPEYRLLRQVVGQRRELPAVGIKMFAGGQRRLLAGQRGRTRAEANSKFTQFGFTAFFPDGSGSTRAGCGAAPVVGSYSQTLFQQWLFVCACARRAGSAMGLTSKSCQNKP